MEPRGGKGRQSVGKHGRMRNKQLILVRMSQNMTKVFNTLLGNNLGGGTQTGILLVGQAQQVFVGAQLVRRLENAMKRLLSTPRICRRALK